MNKPPRRPGAPAIPQASAAGKVRLIGGRWRGTRLSVPALPGLRPTSDRVRETLFNWLTPVLPGARVLDLFAGSGALGLEALSRGAASAVLVERDPGLVAALRALAARLPGGEAANVVQADALSWLPAQADGGFDLAFVDPPFAAGLWDAVLPLVAAKLRPEAWMYVEAPHDAVPQLPQSWRLHREGSTREVRYALYRRSGSATATLAPTPGSD